MNTSAVKFNRKMKNRWACITIVGTEEAWVCAAGTTTYNSEE